MRHGETASNAARILQTPDIPLSERGLAQAERLAERLAGLGVAAILTSDYARARMTAERVRAATGAPLEEWPELRERNFGALRGRAYAELGFDPFAPDYAPPEGESWPAFHARDRRAPGPGSSRARGSPARQPGRDHPRARRARLRRARGRAGRARGAAGLAEHLADHRGEQIRRPRSSF